MRTEESTYSPRGEGTGRSGWFRIGRYDRARRRALWARVVEFDGPPNEEGGEFWMPTEHLELCAGREGDDAYVKVTPDNPIFESLLDCVVRAIGAATDTSWLAGFIPCSSESSSALPKESK